MTISDGYYTVRNAATGELLGIAGASTAYNASVVTGVDNGDNSQVLRVVNEGTNVLLYPAHTIGTDDVVRFDKDKRLVMGTFATQWYRNPQHDDDIDGYGVWTNNGNQYAPAHVDAELWVVEASEEALSVNGVEYPAYYVKTVYEDNSGYDHYLTPSMEGGPYWCTVRRKFVDQQAYTDSYLYQLWAFVPASPTDDELPVPYQGSVSSPAWPDGQTATGFVMFDGDEGVIAPVWMSRGSAHQVRWRKRDRVDQSSSIGDWSAWTTLDGNASCEGWGEDPSAPASGITKTGSDTFAADDGVDIDLKGDVNRTEVEWNVRSVDQPRGVVGGSYGFTSVCIRDFKIVTVACDRTQRGAHISFTTTYPESFIASASAVGMDGSFSRSSSNGQNDIFVGNSSFTFMPNIGDELDILLTVTNQDGYSVTWRGVVEVTMSGSHGEAPTVTCEVDGTLATVTATPPSGMTISGAWLVVPRGHGDRYVELTGDQPWLVVPPLGVPWRVLVTANASGRWGFDATVRDAIVESPPTYHVTSRDGRRDFAIALSKSAPGPSFQVTYTRSKTETETYSRERPTYQCTDVTKASWPLTGDLVARDGLRDADWAAHESHVYFRDPHGFWAQCTVDSFRLDLSASDSQEVQASFSEEVW